MLSKIIRIIKRVVASVEYRNGRYEWYRQTKRLLRQIVADKMTMYPGEARKPFAVIKKEILSLIRTHRESWTPAQTISEYFICGCDRQKAEINDFVFSKEIGLARVRLNGELAVLYKYKSLAGAYLKSRGINASCSLGVVKDGVMDLWDGSSCEITDWLREYAAPVFCKPDDGNQGKSCFRVEYRANNLYVNGMICSREELKDKIAHHIVEPLIVQHADLRRYSPNCVNPLRIRTINVNGDVRYVSTYICIGAADAYFSNVVRCGVAVGLDETGRCITDGFCEVPGMEGRYKTLPGTDIRFEDIVIPGVKDAVELAMAAHRTTPQIFAIGWDVAVTDDGPIIIEGNPDFGPVTYQAISGIGERDFFEKEYKSRF